MTTRIPPLETKIALKSNPLKSRILARRFGRNFPRPARAARSVLMISICKVSQLYKQYIVPKGPGEPICQKIRYIKRNYTEEQRKGKHENDNSSNDIENRNKNYKKDPESLADTLCYTYICTHACIWDTESVAKDPVSLADMLTVNNHVTVVAIVEVIDNSRSNR